MEQITYKEFNQYIDTLASEYMAYKGDYDCFEDYLHQTADGSEYVIYYGKAWDLVNMIRLNDYDMYQDAQSVIYDSYGNEFLDLHRHMALMAYECIYQTLSLAIQDLEKEA